MLMHETIEVQNLLAIILDEAAKQSAKPISAKISCGKFHAINDEVLRSAFEVIARGTVCEGMKLEIETKPMRGQCKNCSQNFDVELSRPNCPQCGSGDFDLLSDAPLVLEEIEFLDGAYNKQNRDR
jgi:hydrogenase nickel incorporation protein HypA/HybF